MMLLGPFYEMTKNPDEMKRFYLAVKKMEEEMERPVQQTIQYGPLKKGKKGKVRKW
jgi:hypothetical protein